MEKRTVTSLDNLIPVFCERLAAGQAVRFSPQGTSMLPFLRENKDTVTIKKITEAPGKYDVVLYKRTNGKYLLHRIVDVKDSYVLMGDNHFVKEFGIEPSQVIAVMTSFERNGHSYSVNNFWYKIYCRVWYHSRSVRHFTKRGFGWVKRHLGGLR